MRAFCLLLLLVNALYFIWSNVIDVRVRSLDRVPARPAVPSRIVLAKEAQRGAPESGPEDEPVPEVRDVVPPTVEPLDSAGTVQPPASTAAAGEEKWTCTSVGPFADLVV